LTLLSILLSLLLIEVWVRFNQPLTVETKNVTLFARQLYEKDEILGWRNKKNFSGFFQQASSSTRVTTNSLGLRGSPELVVNTDKKRILILGDSQTWGYGLNDSEIVSQLLQKRLGTEFAVFNASVLGYGLDQELLWLKRIGEAVKPKLIIVTVNLNDLTNISQKQQYHIWKPIFRIDKGQLVLETGHIDNDLFFEENIMRSVLLNLACVYWIIGKFNQLKNAYLNLNKKRRMSTAYYSLDWMVLSHNPTQRIQSTWVLAERIIVEMNKFASHLGARLILVPLPFVESVSESRWEHVQKQLHMNEDDFDLSIFFKRFKNIAENQKILYVNPLPEFQEYADVANPFGEHHYHFNAVGHQLLAKVLYRSIVKINKGLD
jgi:lysophospholipase L1-like esterase